MIKFPFLLSILSFLVAPLLQAAEDVAYKSREEIPDQYKWDLNRLYESWEAWEADLAKMKAVYDEFAALEGTLSEGPDALLQALQLNDKGGRLIDRLWGYVSYRRDLDQRVNETQSRYNGFLSDYSEARSESAWFDPELLKIPRERVEKWIRETDGLQPYRFDLVDTYIQQAHILDKEGEAIISRFSNLQRNPRGIYESLTTADGPQPVITLSNGEPFTISPGTYAKALNTFENPEDRLAVQTAWMKQFEDRRNTFATIYNGVIEAGWAEAKARGYNSTLASDLGYNQIPVSVYKTLVETAKKGRDVLIDYHAFRKEQLGLERYGWSDMFFPVLHSDETYPYDEVVERVIESVEPLGDAYEAKMREQLSSGLVDVYETPGKRSGAYNSGVYGVGSFVLLNYHNTRDDAFTVAHEMGHSMHTRLAHESQPFVTSSYTIFVAEVAAILNEKLFLQVLLDETEDPRERAALLEKQLDDLHGVFFLQAMMADYEQRAHQLVESGEGISADRLTNLWKTTVRDFFGDTLPEEDPYFHSWARIPHLYRSPYYVYQYATCNASAAMIFERMQNAGGEAKEVVVEQYLNLLRAGGNDYPMNQLQAAGVDLSRPTAVELVVEEFRRLLDRLKTEVGQIEEAA